MVFLGDYVSFSEGRFRYFTVKKEAVFSFETLERN